MISTYLSWLYVDAKPSTDLLEKLALARLLVNWSSQVRYLNY